MNKKNMMIMAGLMFVVSTQAFSVGEQQKDVAYTMKALKQPFAQSLFVKQNVDKLIDLFGMSIKIKENQLQEISIKKTLAKSMAAIGGLGAIKTCGQVGLDYVLDSIPYSPDISPYVIKYAYNCASWVWGTAITTVATYVSLNIYDTYKTKNVLNASLALDKEILAELIAIKESTSLQTSVEVNAQQAEISLI